jgi:hypothetical protein
VAGASSLAIDFRVYLTLGDYRSGGLAGVFLGKTVSVMKSGERQDRRPGECHLTTHLWSNMLP